MADGANATAETAYRSLTSKGARLRSVPSLADSPDAEWNSCSGSDRDYSERLIRSIDPPSPFRPFPSNNRLGASLADLSSFEGAE